MSLSAMVVFPFGLCLNAHEKTEALWAPVFLGIEVRFRLFVFQAADCTASIGAV